MLLRSILHKILLTPLFRMLEITEITLSNLISCVNTLHSTLTALSTACLCKHSTRLFNNSIIETETLLRFLKSVPELQSGSWKLSVSCDKNKNSCCVSPCQNEKFDERNLSVDNGGEEENLAPERKLVEDSNFEQSRDQNVESRDSSENQSQSADDSILESDTSSAFSVLELNPGDDNFNENCSSSDEEMRMNLLKTDLNELDKTMTTLFGDISDKQSTDETSSLTTDSTALSLDQVLAKYENVNIQRPSTVNSDLPISNKLKFIEEDVETLLDRVEAKKETFNRQKEAFNNRLSDLRCGRNLTVSDVISDDKSSEISSQSDSVCTTTISSLSLRTDSKVYTISQSSSRETVVGDDLDKMESELDQISANLDAVLELAGIR